MGIYFGPPPRVLPPEPIDDYDRWWLAGHPLRERPGGFRDHGLVEHRRSAALGLWSLATALGKKLDVSSPRARADALYYEREELRAASFLCLLFGHVWPSFLVRRGEKWVQPCDECGAARGG